MDSCAFSGENKTHVSISIMKPLAKSCATKLLLKLCWITLERGSLPINMEPYFVYYIESSYKLYKKNNFIQVNLDIKFTIPIKCVQPAVGVGCDPHVGPTKCKL